MLVRVSCPNYTGDSALDADRRRWTKARGGVSPSQSLLSGHPGIGLPVMSVEDDMTSPDLEY